MHLKQLSNQTLLLNTKELAARERKITIDILNHLKEIEKRLLHLEMGYGSLFEYATTELKYSESQAQRRISAMRLLKDMPSLESQIEEGSLNLTTASRIQSFIYQSKKENKPLNQIQKQELVKKLENKSSKECDLEFLKLSPESISLKEKERVLSEEYTEIKITIKSELKNKIDKVKSLLSHKNPNPSYAELLDLMCDLVIKQKEPGSGVKNQPCESNKVSTDANQSIQSPSLRINAALKKTTPSRYIPSTIKQEVYMRDKGCCTFKDLKSNRQCSSRHLLQYDHVQPFSHNGETSVQNLRLLCFQHHKLVTQRTFQGTSYG